MIVTAFAQLRFAASLLSGRRFSVRGLRRTVADLRATIEEFGIPTEEARDLLTARAETDPDVIRHMAESRLKKAVRTAAERTPFYADLFNDAEKAAPNALAITRETLAPLDAKERETLMALLEKLR